MWFVTESFLGKLEPMEGVSVAAQAIGCQCGEMGSSRRAGVSVETESLFSTACPYLM